MSCYTHLAQEERYQIYALMKAGHPQAEIAALVGRHPSTVSRELARNRGSRGYRPAQAHARAAARAQAARTRARITAHQWAAVAELLQRQWSPEQIADRAELEGTAAISHESIYRCVYADKAGGGRCGVTCAGGGAIASGTARGAAAAGTSPGASASNTARPRSSGATASATGRPTPCTEGAIAGRS